MPRETDIKQTLCVDIDDFSLHAAVRCGADDRQALEQLCRNFTRYALANGGADDTAMAGTVALMLQANSGLTPPPMKANLQYAAQPLHGANLQQQGAGQPNPTNANDSSLLGEL